LKIFNIFKIQIKTQIHKKIEILWLDNGGEYKSNDFNIFCQDHGITKQFTAPSSLQQSGVNESTAIEHVPIPFDIPPTLIRKDPIPPMWILSGSDE
jgi:transposase InsO family protein